MSGGDPACIVLFTNTVMQSLKLPYGEAIDSIILGVNIDESLKKEILASILKFPNCKLYQAKLHQSEFALDLVLL